MKQLLIILLSYTLLICFLILFIHPYAFRCLNCDISTSVDILDSLDYDCSNVLKGFKTNRTKDWDCGGIIETRLRDSEAKCQTLNQAFLFRKEPLSEEEKNFPLAYGMLVYQNLPQVLFMLSSIYHPQNEYCIAVGENSNSQFLLLLEELATCFPNVYFMRRPPIKWGSFEIINSVYECLRYLSKLGSDWKYFQYLSGVDVPLKTNLEMVKIFKAMNGSPNVEAATYQEERLIGQDINQSPLPLFKSSLSALIPREAANQLTSSNIPRRLLDFLSKTEIADESFWGTLFGNVDKFNISGSMDFQKWLLHKKNGLNKSMTESPLSYYISRDQIWYENQCHGIFRTYSCVYGVGDVPRLLKSRALIAHKFHLDFEPAAYFCLLKEHRRRTLSPDANFNVTSYSELPQVEMFKGVPISEITHQNWLHM